MIICIEESDYLSAAQSLDRNHVFEGKFLAVFHEKVSLNGTRSPLETAEQSLSWSLVYVLPVPSELLGTPKAFVAISTDSWHLRVTTASCQWVSWIVACPPSPVPWGRAWYTLLQIMKNLVILTS